MGVFGNHVIPTVIARVCQRSGIWKEDDRYVWWSMEGPEMIYLCFIIIYSYFYCLDSWWRDRNERTSPLIPKLCDLYLVCIVPKSWRAGIVFLDSFLGWLGNSSVLLSSLSGGDLETSFPTDLAMRPIRVVVIDGIHTTSTERDIVNHWSSLHGHRIA